MCETILILRDGRVTPIVRVLLIRLFCKYLIDLIDKNTKSKIQQCMGNNISMVIEHTAVSMNKIKVKVPSRVSKLRAFLL